MSDPKVITIHTTVYAPWEEGEDERAKISEESETVDVSEWISYQPGDDDHLTPVACAASILTGDVGPSDRFHAMEPSSFPLARDNALRTWWSAECYPHPYDGTEECRSAHLSGFTQDEAWEIHTRVAAWLREKFHKVIPIDA